MNPVKLIVTNDGDLCTPFEAIPDDVMRNYYRDSGMTDPFVPEADRKPSDPLLMVVYDAGDCDVASWPLKTKKLRQRLASALYAARETGTIPDVAEVILPDGKTFVIDQELEDETPAQYRTRTFFYGEGK